MSLVASFIERFIEQQPVVSRRFSRVKNRVNKISLLTLFSPLYLPLDRL